MTQRAAGQNIPDDQASPMIERGPTIERAPMIKRGPTDWNAEQDLAALLDALTAELLAARDHDIATWLRDAGDPAEAAAQSIRRLVAAADSHGIAPHVSNALAAGLRAAMARNQ